MGKGGFLAQVAARAILSWLYCKKTSSPIEPIGPRGPEGQYVKRREVPRSLVFYVRPGPTISPMDLQHIRIQEFGEVPVGVRRSAEGPLECLPLRFRYNIYE